MATNFAEFEAARHIRSFVCLPIILFFLISSVGFVFQVQYAGTVFWSERGAPAMVNISTDAASQQDGIKRFIACLLLICIAFDWSHDKPIVTHPLIQSMVSQRKQGRKMLFVRRPTAPCAFADMDRAIKCQHICKEQC